MENKDIDLLQQTPLQRQILLARQPYGAETIIEIVKQALPKDARLVGNTEFETICNAIRMDAYQDIMLNLVNYLTDLKSGEIINKQIK